MNVLVATMQDDTRSAALPCVSEALHSLATTNQPTASVAGVNN